MNCESGQLNAFYMSEILGIIEAISIWLTSLLKKGSITNVFSWIFGKSTEHLLAADSDL